MTGRFHLERPARMEHLRALVQVGLDAAEAAGADDSTRHAVRLAVEEVCTNIMVHGYDEGQTGRISVDADFDDHEITIYISDDAPVFDLESVPMPDTTSSAMDRPIGGLGWHLVQSIMDRVEQHGTGEVGNVFMIAKRFQRAGDAST